MSEFTDDTLAEWLQNLKHIAEGAAQSGVDLREDLQTEATAKRTEFSGLVMTLDNQRVEKAQVQREAQAAKDVGLSLLGKVQGELTSNVSEDKKSYVLELYRVDAINTTDRYKVLALLQHVTTVSAAQTEAQYQVSATLLQEIQTTAETLSTHLDKIMELQADLAETRLAITTLIPKVRYLKKRVRGYLISVLPKGKKDPKLIDFGFRIRGRRRASSTVTVVEGTENTESTEPVVVEEQPVTQ